MDFGIQFRKWLKDNPQPTGAYELKQTKTDSILFSCLEDNQIDYALATQSSKGILIRVQGLSGEQDYINLVNVPSYVVIKFKSGFVIIPIHNFLACKTKSKRRSLTFLEAELISLKTIKL